MSTEQLLGVPAVKLYAMAVHLSRQWQKRHVKLSDVQMASITGLDVDALRGAQEELAKAELLTITHVGSKTRYVFAKTSRD